MANTKIPSYKEINNAIKKIADIPSRVDDEGYIIADGVSLTKNVYDPKNGDYELHIRDKKNNKWQSFDTEDGADCVERAAKCFVDFYNAKHKSESHKPSCSMQKKKESLANKDLAYNGFMTQWQTDVIDGLSSYMDMLGFNLDYNEEEKHPLHGMAARFDVTLDDGTDMGSIGTNYFHTYTDTSFTHSKPFPSRQFSNPSKVVDKFVELIQAYNSKSTESKKSEGLEDQPKKVQKMVQELAEETGNDVADAQVDEEQCPGIGFLVTFGDEEYYCYEDYDMARGAAFEGIYDLLDDIGIDGINFDNIGGIEQFVDTGWFDDAKRESAEFYVSDIKESEPERYKEEFGDLDEEDAVEQVLANEEEDSIEWYINNYGSRDFEQVAKQNNLVDYQKLTRAILDADGPANELAGYDGKEIELPCGYYCYRHN